MEKSESIIEAIHDLTRVIIALDGSCPTKAVAVRKLDALGIPASRIAAIMAIPPKDVRSQLSKDRKKSTKSGAPIDGE